MMGSSQVIRESSISVLACVLIVALGPIQFGFTVLTVFYLIASIICLGNPGCFACDAYKLLL